MRSYTLPIAGSVITAVLGGTISWATSSPIWVGALIGAAFPLVFFAGAMLAVYGMFVMVEDYLKEKSR